MLLTTINAGNAGLAHPKSVENYQMPRKLFLLGHRSSRNYQSSIIGTYHILSKVYRKQFVLYYWRKF